MMLADRRLLAREALLSAALAGSLAALLLWTTPPGIDWAAHAYQRTFLLQHGFAIWNNFWYAGRYSFVTYSLLYYPLAALLGIRVLARRVDRERRGRRSAWSCSGSGGRSRVSRAARSPSCGSASSARRRSRSRSRSRSRCLRSGRCRRDAAAASRCARCSRSQRARSRSRSSRSSSAALAFARRSLRGARVQIAAVGACALAELVLVRLFGDGGHLPVRRCSSSRRRCSSARSGSSSRAASRRRGRSTGSSGSTSPRASSPTSCRRPSARTSSGCATSRSRSR